VSRETVSLSRSAVLFFLLTVEPGAGKLGISFRLFMVLLDDKDKYFLSFFEQL
jgi:hypothetical protein